MRDLGLVNYEESKKWHNEQAIGMKYYQGVLWIKIEVKKP